jgi:hypothetical protein
MAKKREYTRRKWRIGKKWNYITDQWLYYVESRRAAFKIFKYWDKVVFGIMHCSDFKETDKVYIPKNYEPNEFDTVYLVSEDAARELIEKLEECRKRLFERDAMIKRELRENKYIMVD